MQQETASHFPEKPYCLDGDLWRSALYMMIGAVVACGLFPRMLHLQGRLSPTPLIIGVTLFAGFLVVGISLLLPRLRIDETGIHRRLFFWYRDSWRWEEFGSGKIREGAYLDSYQDISRPAWRQVLALGNYPTESRGIVRSTLQDKAVNFQVKLPESISVKVGSWKWQFDNNGGSLQEPDSKTEFRWEDIRTVSVTKLTHDHQNFSKVVLELNDRKLVLQTASPNGQPNQNWKGDPAEEILGFLQRHLPTEKITIDALNGLPRAEAEAESRLQKTHREIRGLKKVLIFEYVLLTAAAILAPFIFSPLPMVLFGILSAIIALLVFVKSAIWNAIQRLEIQCAEIDDWLNSNSNSETLGAT